MPADDRRGTPSEIAAVREALSFLEIEYACTFSVLRKRSYEYRVCFQNAVSFVQVWWNRDEYSCWAGYLVRGELPPAWCYIPLDTLLAYVGAEPRGTIDFSYPQPYSTVAEAVGDVFGGALGQHATPLLLGQPQFAAQLGAFVSSRRPGWDARTCLPS
jgi:hypothetical protein